MLKYVFLILAIACVGCCFAESTPAPNKTKEYKCTLQQNEFKCDGMYSPSLSPLPTMINNHNKMNLLHHHWRHHHSPNIQYALKTKNHIRWRDI